MMISRRRTLVFLAASAALPLAAACGESAAETAKITIMLDWVPNTNHTGLYVAIDQGYYAEENLTATIVEPGTLGVEAAVASGAADFGVSFQEQVTLARVQDVPIVSVAAVIQHNTSGFAAPTDRKIRRPRDFEGRTYGGFGLEIETQVLRALMECDGGDFDQIEFVDIGASDPFVAWERGDVDFVWIFEGWTGIEARMRGVELTFLRLNDLECIPDYYTPVLVTGERMLSEREDVVQRFVRATARGYQYAIDQPEAAAEILIKRAEGINAELVRASQPWLSERYAADTDRWGMQTRATWSAYADWMLEHGLLERAINPNNAFDASFIRNL